MGTSYYLGSRLLAERSFLKPPLSFAFFCSTCGEVWGRVWTEGRPWVVRQVPCEDHQPAGVWNWNQVPGSFLDRDEAITGYPGAALCVELVPADVLAREVEVHLNYIERQNDEQ